MTIKSAAAQEVTIIQARLTAVCELLKEYSDMHDGVQQLKTEIKEINEKIKSMLLAEVDYFALTEEKKEKTKELKQAAKTAVKEIDINPVMLVAFIKARQKEDAVDKIKLKGSIFSRLDREL